MATPSTDSAAMRAILRSLVNGGCTLRQVFDGEDVTDVSSVAEALRVILAVDDATVSVWTPDGSSGWVWFVLGNSPEEVVADHTVNLSEWIDPVCHSWWY